MCVLEYKHIFRTSQQSSVQYLCVCVLCVCLCVSVLVFFLLFIFCSICKRNDGVFLHTHTHTPQPEITAHARTKVSRGVTIILLLSYISCYFVSLVRSANLHSFRWRTRDDVRGTGAKFRSVQIPRTHTPARTIQL